MVNEMIVAGSYVNTLEGLEGSHGRYLGEMISELNFKRGRISQAEVNGGRALQAEGECMSTEGTRE